MAVSSAGHASPDVLASTIGTLGRLGFADEMVLDSLARHLMPGVRDLNTEQIAALVSGFAACFKLRGGGHGGAGHALSAACVGKVAAAWHQLCTCRQKRVCSKVARACPANPNIHILGIATACIVVQEADVEPRALSCTMRTLVLAAAECAFANNLPATAVQVEGLKGADHSPSVLLLDEVHERLSELQQSVPQDQAHSIKQGLQQLGRDDSNLPNADGADQPDRIKYS